MFLSHGTERNPSEPAAGRPINPGQIRTRNTCERGAQTGFSKEAYCGLRDTKWGGGLSRFSCRRDGGGRTLGGHSSDHRFMRRDRDEKFRNVLPTGGREGVK